MQDEAPIAPFIRPAIADRGARQRKMRRRGRADKGCHLGRSGGGAVWGASKARRQRGGDAPAPGQLWLAHLPGPGVHKGIALQLVHQDEGVEGHVLPCRFHRSNCFDDRLIGGCPAIDRPPPHLGHFLGHVPRDPARTPRHAHAVQRLLFHLRPNCALTTAQIVAEPRHHQRGRPHPRHLFGQLLQ